MHKRRAFAHEQEVQSGAWLAFPRPKAYPAHSATLTAGLLASFPRRSFTAAVRDQGWQTYPK
jgi:hypothetical protein